MVGVGTWGTLCRGVSRGSVVLPPRRGSGGLDGFVKCCEGGQTVLLFLWCRPLRAQVAKQGGRVPFAAPRYRRSPQPPLRGRARRLAFPRPSRVLHPHLSELGREDCGAHRGRLSGQVERLLGVPGIWGWGLQETRLLSCALLGLQLRLVLLLFFGQSLEGGQALGV